MKAGLWLAGGFCAAVGILLMIGGFGDSGFGLFSDGQMQPAALSFHRFGYDATMDLKASTNGYMGIALILTGLVLMVYCNAGAWRDTNNEY